MKGKIDLPEELTDFIKKWKEKPGNLIPILHKVQQIYGYISEEIAMAVAQELDAKMATIYGVVTFYHFFKLRKPGKHKIMVCMGTACYLKGNDQLLKALQSLLNITVGQTTDDGLFTLETVRCVGCCGLAPVMVIDEDVYGNLEKENLPTILAKYTHAGKEA